MSMLFSPCSSPRPVADTASLSKVAALCEMLSHSPRLAILSLLDDGPARVAHIAEAVGMSQPLTSHHLKLLKLSGLVVDGPTNHTGVAGRAIAYRLTEAGKGAVDVIRFAADRV